MPQSLSGWQWRRCRVKIKEGVYNGRRDPHRTDCAFAGNLHHESKSEWSDCPGCAKCEKTNGLVLRRGSWRPTSSWEPVLMLAKSGKYFADGEAVKTPSASATVSRNKYTRILDDPDEQFAVQHDHETTTAGANLRDVWRSTYDDYTKEELIEMLLDLHDGGLTDEWRIAAEPLKEKHYAAFPTRLVENCLRAGTSARGYCPVCGAPWVRVVETKFYGSYHNHEGDGEDYGLRQQTIGPRDGKWVQDEYEPPKTIGWRPSCSHDAEPRAGVVLDPFAGSGRTGLCARKLGLDFVGIELNPEYSDMASRILRDDAPLFTETP
jgi:hypothetical protein